MNEVVETLQKLKGIRWKVYSLPSNASIELTSYNIPEHLFKQNLPTKARGLFLYKTDDWKIGVRGYNKFFNGFVVVTLVGEIKETTWQFLKENTLGPYEITLKENGCIIFVSSVLGNLVVTSKHALGGQNDNVSHAQKGEEWLDYHLENSQSSRQELIEYLSNNNVTAVFELADDDFEEHILEYPKERRGLYCHGINENTLDFHTKSMDEIKRFAIKFGFKVVSSFNLQSLEGIRK